MKRLNRIKYILPAVLLATYLPAYACQMTYGTYVSAADWRSFTHYWSTSELKQALENGTGCKIKLQAFSSERDLYEAAVRKRVDFAFLKDFALYMGQKKNPALQPIVATLSRGLAETEPKPYYNAYVLTLVSSHIKSINDLNGEKMGSTRKESTSSYILPKDYFDKNNLKVNSEFYSTEKALFAALARRKVSAIATWDWAVSNNNVKKIHILKTFEQIPNPPIVITHKMDPQKLTNVKNALVQIQIADKTQPTVGYANVAPNMYDALFSIYDSYCKNNLKECEW